MRIAYVCNEYPASVERLGAYHGGIGTVVKSLAEGMAARGHEVTVVGVYGERGDEMTNGVRTVRLGHSAARGLRWYLDRKALLRWLQDEADRNGLDIVEAPEFAGWLMQPPRGSVSVLRLHGPSFYFPIAMSPWRSVFVAKLERQSLKKIPNWIGVSNYVLEYLKGVVGTSQRNTVITNPVDAEFLQIPSSPPRVSESPLVLYLGTLAKHKGVMELAHSARSFLRQIPDLRMALVGKDSLVDRRRMSDIVRTILGPEFSDRVEFVGSVPHERVREWMTRATVVVAPSFSETCGMVWLEAMAAGKPVVASRLSCGPEIVKDGVTGLLVDPHVPEEIANAVVALIRDPQFAGKLGRNARYQVAQKHSLESVLDQTTAFYSEIMN